MDNPQEKKDENQDLQQQSIQRLPQTDEYLSKAEYLPQAENSSQAAKDLPQAENLSQATKDFPQAESLPQAAKDLPQAAAGGKDADWQLKDIDGISEGAGGQPKGEPGDKSGKEFLRALSFFSQIGITMAACVFIGVILGKYLDNLLGTSPWLLLVFSLLGAGAAFKSLFDLGNK